MNWLRSRWRSLAGFAGFLVGALADTSGAQQTTTVAQTIIDRQTVTVPGPIRVHTKVKTIHTPAAALAREQSSLSAGSTRSFTGNGAKNLGTIMVDSDSTVRWTNNGEVFQVFDDEFGFGINSDGHSGESALPAGTYKNVSVNAMGNWTLRIVR